MGQPQKYAGGGGGGGGATAALMFPVEPDIPVASPDALIDDTDPRPMTPLIAVEPMDEDAPDLPEIPERPAL